MITSSTITNEEQNLAEAKFAKTLEHLGLPNEFEFEIEWIDEDEIRQLNSDHRAKDKATDVLSFPYTEFKMPYKKADYADDINPENGKVMLGAIVICKEHMGDLSFSELAVHGMLHLLGYDHETDADYEKMRGVECLINSDS